MVLGKKNIYAEGAVSRNRYPYLSGEVKRTNRDFLEFVSNRTEELKTLRVGGSTSSLSGPARVDQASRHGSNLAGLGRTGGDVDAELNRHDGLIRLLLQSRQGAEPSLA